MKKKLSIVLLAVFLYQGFFLPPLAFSDSSMSVYAAASLIGPLKEIISLFEEDTGIQVKAQFSSSGNLARQIEQGAPADVYFSASEQWMRHLEARSRIVPQTKIFPVGNSIVLVAPSGRHTDQVRFDKEYSLSDSFKGKMAMGDPAHVPAGQYAKQAMETLGWWDSLQPRIIRAKDVRQALWIVSSQEAAVGIVFGSDAAQTEKVAVIGVFPEELHDPIIYSAALCAGRVHEQRGLSFLRFLMSAQAQEIFHGYGFTELK